MQDACGKVRASHVCLTILAGRWCSCSHSPDCFCFYFLIQWLPGEWESVCRVRPTNVLFPFGNLGILLVFSWFACCKFLLSLRKNFHASHKGDSGTSATSATSSSFTVALQSEMIVQSNKQPVYQPPNVERERVALST